MKRFALHGGTAFVVFKDIKISLVFFVSFLGDAKKKENRNVIETWTKHLALKHFSIQFSIENHLPSKERRQARSDNLEASSFSTVRKRPTKLSRKN